MCAKMYDDNVDWNDESVCYTIDTGGCIDTDGNVMMIPSVRKWDCLDNDNDEMTQAQKTFIENVELYCERGETAPEHHSTSKKSSSPQDQSAGRTVLIVFLTLLVLVLVGVVSVWFYRRRYSREAFFMPVSRQAIDEDGNELSCSFSPLSENPITANPLTQPSGV